VKGARLLDWLAALAPGDRDAALERWLGIEVDAGQPGPAPRDGQELIGYVPSGVAAIVQAAFAAPVGRQDFFLDVGAGAGKVALTMHLLTGARCHGLEVQPELVARARSAAVRLGVAADVTFEVADARTAELPPATVFYLYLPFTGSALERALARLEVAASGAPVVVCALGLDLRAPWLRPRPSEAFWLTVYDSGPPREARRVTPAAAAVIAERELTCPDAGAR
jgi:SAM-dependent methyltransferase